MELLDTFHFARPWALFLIPIAIIQGLWYLSFRHVSNPWQDLMRPDLQQQLLIKPDKQPMYRVWMVVSLTLAGIALAGPSWSQQSRPAMIKQDNLVIVLDLSLSMLAGDVAPDRITRSKQKLQDLLTQRSEGMTALVGYSGDAHTITPLTRDTATIRNLLPALNPLIMPVLGSSAEAGVQKAIEIIKQSGFSKARILLITDGLDQAAQEGISKRLSDDIRLSILPVGTSTGAPIPLASQGFVKDEQGNVIISRLDQAELEHFAAGINARIHPLTLNEDDLEYLLPEEIELEQIREVKAQLPLWIEQGHWFLLPVLPLAALAFRRNGLLVLALVIFLGNTSPAFAFWPENPQSKGEEAFTQGNYAEAERLLEEPLWRGSTYYRQKDYQQAISEFSKSDTPQAHYNRGNALTQLGKYQEAIDAYSLALEQAPDLKDAEFNRSIAEKLLKLENQKNSSNGNPEQQSRPDSQNSPEQQSNAPKPSSANSSDASRHDNQAGSETSTPHSASQSSSQQQMDSDTSSKPIQQASEPSHAQQPSNLLKPNTPEQTQTPLGQETANQLTESSGMTEEELSLEQWLRRIPDDPAGLLRRKFEYEANQRREPLPEGRAPW